MEVLCVDGKDSLYTGKISNKNSIFNGTIKKFQWNPLDRVDLSEMNKKISLIFISLNENNCMV